MDYRHIRLEVGPMPSVFAAGRGSRLPVVAWVALNRPEVRNAMDDTTLRELADCFRRLAREKGLRAVVVRGEGPDFCAGADVNWMRRAGALGPAQGRRDARLLAEMCRAVDECPVPVLARAHGSVYGGGLGLAACCDVVVAAKDAKMCFSECRLGILPAVVSCFVLPKIGPARARRYTLTAEVFGMEDAREMGLVHMVAPLADLDERVEALLGSVLRNGPKAVREAKALIRRLSGGGLERRLGLAIKALVRARSSPEGQEGLSAFLEKRAPSWIAPG